MAYIKKEESAAIRKELKEAFPKTKFSVKIRNHSTVDITVKEDSSLDWSNIYTDLDVFYRGDIYLLHLNMDRYRTPEFINVVDEWLNSNPTKWTEHPEMVDRVHVFFTDEQKEFFEKIREIAKAAPIRAGLLDKWEDKSDIYTDYFQVTYYIDINIDQSLNPLLKGVQVRAA
jgi:hypothetical protein